MKKYPAIKILILIVTAILFSKCFNPKILLFTSIISTVILILFFNRIKFLCLPILFLFFFSIYYFDFNKRDSNLENILNLNQEFEFTFKIIDEPKFAKNKTTTLVEIENVEIENKNYNLKTVSILNFRGFLNLKYGEVYKSNGILSPPIANRNPGSFNYKEYLALQNVYSIITIDKNSKLIISNPNSGNYFYKNIVIPSREFIRKTTITSFSEENRNFILGLLLGDRTNISDEIKNAFINTGTIHVLAVSGSHVILVVACIFYLFGFLRFEYKIKIILSILVLIFYTFLTGNSPSVERAVIMSIIILLGKLFEERTNIYNSIAVAGIFLLLKNPNDLFDAGFQLSFSAVISMIFFYPKILNSFSKIKFQYIRPIFNLLSLTIAAQIGTIPFTIFYFKSISIISIFVNLIVVPLVGVIIILGFISILLAIISFSVSNFYNIINNILIYFTLKFVKSSNEISFGRIEIFSFDFTDALLYLIIIFLIIYLKNKIVFKRLIFTLLLIINFKLFFIYFDEPNSELIFFDVGQGDATLISCKCGKNAMIDSGPIFKDKSEYEKTILPYLKSKNIEKLNYIFISHPHDDHYGGIVSLLNTVQYDSIYDSGVNSDSEIFKNYKLIAKNKVVSISNGRIISLCMHSKIYVFSPEENSNSKDYNNSSLVLKFVNSKTSVLFPGDIEIEAESKISKTYASLLKSDILKSPHHGSKTSSSYEFLNIVKPKIVVIQVGKFNKFGHPSKNILSEYKNINAKIFRTDLDGAIIYDLDQNKITTTLKN